MKFPHREVHSPENAGENFAFLEGSGIYWGVGVPTFVPVDQNASRRAVAAFYFRQDTPGTANQRLYVWNGSTWTGIL